MYTHLHGYACDYYDSRQSNTILPIVINNYYYPLHYNDNYYFLPLCTRVGRAFRRVIAIVNAVERTLHLSSICITLRMVFIQYVHSALQSYFFNQRRPRRVASTVFKTFRTSEILRPIYVSCTPVLTTRCIAVCPGDEEVYCSRHVPPLLLKRRKPSRIVVTDICEPIITIIINIIA